MLSVLVTYLLIGFLLSVVTMFRLNTEMCERAKELGRSCVSFAVQLIVTDMLIWPVIVYLAIKKILSRRKCGS